MTVCSCGRFEVDANLHRAARIERRAGSVRQRVALERRRARSEPLRPMNSVRSPVTVRSVAAEQIEERDAIGELLAKRVAREERAGRRLAARDDVEARCASRFSPSTQST